MVVGGIPTLFQYILTQSKTVDFPNFRVGTTIGNIFPQTEFVRMFG